MWNGSMSVLGTWQSGSEKGSCMSWKRKAPPHPPPQKGKGKPKETFSILSLYLPSILNVEKIKKNLKNWII